MNKNIMNRADETQEIEKSPAEESEVVEEPKPVWLYLIDDYGIDCLYPWRVWSSTQG